MPRSLLKVIQKVSQKPEIIVVKHLWCLTEAEPGVAEIETLIVDESVQKTPWQIKKVQGLIQRPR